MEHRITLTHSVVDFASKICDELYLQSKISIESRGYFTLVLSGGNTPQIIFKELRRAYKKKIDWANVHLFWVDERCVEPTNTESNYNLVKNNLLSELREFGSVHRMEGELGSKLGANNYIDKVTSFFEGREVIFDFVLLGMGEDGHVASIFPESKEIESKDTMVMGTTKKHYGFHRITFGLDLINACRYKLLMVVNEEKIHILNTGDKKFPINQLEELHIFTTI